MKPTKECVMDTHTHLSLTGKETEPIHTYKNKFHALCFIYTSIHVLAAEVPPVEEHQLNFVAFVEGDEEDEQQ